MLAAVAAARAQSVQLHVATIDPKAVQRRSLSVQCHGNLIEVDVPHLPAAPAHEMMVVIRIDFELDGGAAALQRADQTRRTSSCTLRYTVACETVGSIRLR